VELLSVSSSDNCDADTRKYIRTYDAHIGQAQGEVRVVARWHCITLMDIFCSAYNKLNNQALQMSSNIYTK